MRSADAGGGTGVRLAVQDGVQWLVCMAFLGCRGVRSLGVRILVLCPLYLLLLLSRHRAPAFFVFFEFYLCHQGGLNSERLVLEGVGQHLVVCLHPTMDSCVLFPRNLHLANMVDTSHGWLLLYFYLLILLLFERRTHTHTHFHVLV